MANITLLFPTFNRLEFTKVALETLLENTTPKLIKEFLVVDGPSEDGTTEYLTSRLAKPMPFPTRLIRITERHVVQAMLMARDLSKTPLIAKIDSDTMVPSGWLDACVDVMGRNEDLWALGIEPFSEIKDWPPDKRGVNNAQFVGGIGLFQKKAWNGLRAAKPPFFGWTEHQEKSTWRKGWLHPAMNVFLLDHLPFEPFCSLSKTYVAKNWQRAWPFYPKSCAPRWEWRFPAWDKSQVKDA